MTILTPAILAASLLSSAPSVVAMHPGDAVLLIVTDRDQQPLPGVNVSLSPTRQEPGASPPATSPLITDHDGQARFSLPGPGSYTLRLQMTGFLSVLLGPFAVCPAASSSCGPSVVTPLRTTLPNAAFVDGVELR